MKTDNADYCMLVNEWVWPVHLGHVYQFDLLIHSKM